MREFRIFEFLVCTIRHQYDNIACTHCPFESLGLCTQYLFLHLLFFNRPIANASRQRKPSRKNAGRTKNFFPCFSDSYDILINLTPIGVNSFFLPLIFRLMVFCDLNNLSIRLYKNSSWISNISDEIRILVYHTNSGCWTAIYSFPGLNNFSLKFFEGISEKNCRAHIFSFIFLCLLLKKG